MLNILSCLAWLFISVLMQAIATLLLPETENFKIISLTMLCLTCYAISFYALAKVMYWVTPVTAWSMWSGLGIVVIALMSSVFQPLRRSALETLGIGCIVAGLIVMAL